MQPVYQCSKCTFKGLFRNSIKHFTIKHAPEEEVPFRCSTCQFKTISYGKWARHAKLNPSHSCIECKNPYPVSVDSDIYLAPITIDEQCEIVEVTIDPKDEKIAHLESTIADLKEQHNQEITALKERNTFECLRLGNFIEKQEKTKVDLKEEIKILQGKLNKFSTPYKKLQSVVMKVQNKHKH